jgi:hypothetical protein
MKTTKPPTGRTIVLELRQEMEDRLYPLLYRTLAPSVYHVYLHPDDFREIEPIASLIIADAKQGLTTRAAELNRRSAWSTLVSGKQSAVEIPAGGWDVQLHAEMNGDLQRGEIGIESRLAVPPPARFTGGTPTTRIARTVVTGTVRRSQTFEEPADRAGASAAHAAGAKTTTSRAGTVTFEGLGGSTQEAGGSPTQNPASVAMGAPQQAGGSTQQDPPYGSGGAARLSYVDDDGPHVFVMRKDVISIGRGGSAFGVDVQVMGGPRLSREHCRIRRTSDGRFLLQDLSTWGTSIDGQRVPSGSTADGGSGAPREHPLPRRASIQLADAVAIDFEVS